MEPTIERKCTICQEAKPLSEFYLHGKTKAGVQKIGYRCKKCDNVRTDSRKKNRPPTKSQLIRKMYNAQISRSKKRGHHPPKYSLTELRIWMLSQDIFHELFKEWVDSEKQEMKIPTCDRLDNTKGYTFDNIRIVTLQENLKQAGLDTILGVDKRTCTPIKQYSMQGQFIKEHHSISAAARSINGDSNAISKCKNGKQKFHKGFIWKL